jgi:hypothetical protein
MRFYAFRVIAFRTKRIPYPEWTAFQTRFDALFTEWKATPRTALFKEQGAYKEAATLLIPNFRCEEIEALSPGQWADLPDPSGRNWIVLVGRAGALRHFGLV